jgi:peptide chain release factor 3
LAQPFELPDSFVRLPLVGVVGSLQLDVLKYRLETEYAAEVRLEYAPWTIVRWLREKQPADAPKPAKGAALPKPNLVASYDTTLALDSVGNWVALFSDKISANYFETKNGEKFDISPFPF